MSPPFIWRLLAPVAMIAIGVLPAWIWRRRHGLRWRVVWLGVASFLACQLPVALLAFRRNVPVRIFLLQHVGAWGERAAYPLVMGLLIALAMVGLLALFVAFTPIRRAGWEDTILFALSASGCATVVLGADVLVAGVQLAYDLAVRPDAVERGTRELLAHHRGVTAVLAPVVERASALVARLLLVLLVVAGFRTGRLGRWLALALGYFLLVAIPSVWVAGLLPALDWSVHALGVTQVALAAFAALAWLGVAPIRRRAWPESLEPPRVTPVAAEPPGSCARHEIAIEQQLHGALPPEALPSLEAHLAVCAGCRAYRDAAARSDGGIGALGALAGRATDWEAVESRIRRRAAFPVRALSAGLGGAALLVPALAWLTAPPGERRLVAVSLALLSGGGLLAAAIAAARRVRRFARLQGPEELLAYHRRRLQARIRWLERWPWAALALVLFQLADFASWGGPTGSLRIALALLVLLAAALWAQGVVVRLPRYRRELAELEPGGPGAP